MKLHIFAFAAVLAATGATADTLTDLVGSKAYWKTMDWEKAEQSNIWRLNGWVPYEGEQDAGRTFTKKRIVNIDGQTLGALLIVEGTSTRRDMLSVSSGELSSIDCQQLGDWLTRKFGPPKRMVDGGYKFDLGTAGNVVESIDRMSQWDIGSTRTTLTCLGIKTAAAEELGEKNKILSALVFGSKASEREIKPLFGLRCTQRIEYVGIVRPSENLADILLIIDENRKRVLTADKVPSPGKHQITDHKIVVKIEKDDRTIDYSIDRRTGAFKTEVRYLNGSGANVTGNCEKNEPEYRKF